MLVENRAGSERALGILILFEILVFAFTGPNFFSAANAFEMIRLGVELGLLALALTPVIVTGGIDLSVGAILVLSSMVMGKLAVQSGVPVYAAVPIGMAVGVIMGWINGALVSYMRIPPFIVTLGTLSIFNAVKLFYTHSESIRAMDLEEQTPSLLFFGENINVGFTGGFHVTFNSPPADGDASIILGTIALILLAWLAWYMLYRTPWGRHVHALGDDPDAAMLSGIRINKTLVSVYAMAGLICGFGAWVSIGRVGSISPLGFDTINLDSITAVVIGGTSLFGGRGSIVGSVLGALIVGVFSTGLSIAGVDDYWQYFAAGCLVISAVALDQWLRRASQ